MTSKDITRPPKAQIDALKLIGAATVAGTLYHLGVKKPAYDRADVLAQGPRHGRPGADAENDAQTRGSL